jgi:hypothetical protein
MLSPQPVFRSLERHERYGTLAALGSAYWTVRQRQPCLMKYRDGRWILRFREGRVASP